MGRTPLRVTDADVHLGLAEPDRLELGVDVGDVDQRDVAEVIEFEQFVLAQALLRGQPAPPAASQ